MCFVDTHLLFQDLAVLRSHDLFLRFEKISTTQKCLKPLVSMPPRMVEYLGDPLRLKVGKLQEVLHIETPSLMFRLEGFLNCLSDLARIKFRE